MKSISKSKIFVLVLFLPVLLWGQKKQNYYLKPLVDLTFSPVSIIDPTHPQLRFGGDYYLKDKISLGADIGFGFTGLYKIVALSPNFEKYNYFQIRPQAKFILNNKDKFKLYLGLEPFYMFEKCTLTQGYVYTYKNFEPVGMLHFDRASFKKSKYGLNLNFGFKAYTNKLFFFEMYFGGGLFYKNADVYDFENPIYYPHYNSELPTVSPGTGISPNITLGIKIGLKLIYTLQKTN